MPRYTSVWYSNGDPLSPRSDDEKRNSVDSTDNESHFSIFDLHSGKTSTKFVSADFVELKNVSSYSPGSDTTRGRMSEEGGGVESTEDTDSGITVSGYNETSDLRARIRRFEEENAILREDFLTAEELVTSLQKQMQHLRVKLDQTKERCRKLETENDEHQELLHETKQKERDCRWAIQKLEKEKNSLMRQVEDLETEKLQIATLTGKLERCKKEKYDCMRQITLCKRELEDRERDCDILREQLAQLSEANKTLQQSYQETVQRLRQKLRELKDENFILRASDSMDSASDGLRSSTPGMYVHSNAESISYNESRIHDSLYDEFKASGFLGANESRVRELESELLWYEEEIRQATLKLNNIMEELYKQRSKPPNVPQLDFNNSVDDKTPEMSLFLRTLSQLSQTVKEIIGSRVKVKDASCQLSLDARQADESLSSLFRIPSFQHHFRLISEKQDREKEEDIDIYFGGNWNSCYEAFSMNSRLLGEYVAEVESLGSSEVSANELRERSLIGPIVQELDRIIKSTNVETIDPVPMKFSQLTNPPKHRCIYTSVNDSMLDSTGTGFRNSTGDHFGSTYIVGGSESRDDRMRDNEEERMTFNSQEDQDRTNDQDESNAGGDCSRSNLESKDHLNECYSNNDKVNIFDRYGMNSNDDKIGRADIGMGTMQPGRKESLGDSSMESTETPKRLPKRKISVFHRSFDIDSVNEETGITSERARYRLRERASSLATPDQDNLDDDGLDPEFMKMSSNTRKFLLTYREKEEDEDDDDEDKDKEIIESSPVPVTEISKRTITLAPARLNLVSQRSTESLLEDHPERFDVSEPSNEVAVQRGVTFRKKVSAGDLDLSEFSILEENNHELSQDRFPARVDSQDYTNQGTLSELHGQEADRERRIIENCTPRIPVAGRKTERRQKKRQAGNSEGVIGRKKQEDEEEEDKKSRASGSVTLAMSSGEESSDSECDPMAIRSDIDNNQRNVLANETRSVTPTLLNFVDGALLSTSTPANINNNNNEYSSNNNNLKKLDEIPHFQKKPQTNEKRERARTIRRSLSESGCASWECRCHPTKSPQSGQEYSNKDEIRVFPSLTDARLQGSGLAKSSSNNDDINGGNLPETELERKYMALSIGLVTDRVTLSRRVALSIRQRDQSEKNLATEVYKMHQDIQDLAPLCIDRESVERVERVKHQLEMINQCAHRVSCTAETLGAVHQESRVSRAVLLADRYILLLRSRCDKLALDLSETKRILSENNIVIEEHNGELGGDDMPRTRYRAVPITNRTMMARRRASIATIFRPLGNFQEVTKEGLRQRNSVSGRVTLRRPSLTAESQKWETDKLDRTDSSSSSIGELREIFEQAESRRNSREENNNSILRLHSSNLSLRDSDVTNEADIWITAREEPIVHPIQSNSIITPATDDNNSVHQTITNTTIPYRGRRALAEWIARNRSPWRQMLWYILISFFFGFYVSQVVSSTNECSGRHWRWWSIEEIREHFYPLQDNLPRPI